MNWYIDALDGLGGLAFASFRTDDLVGGEIEFEAEAWVIEAPDFRPRSLTSRVVGFAATGRGLQIGFSMDGETEEAFPSLDALSDFVRRTFLSGAGGDGAGGIVPPAGRPPGGGDFDGPVGEPPRSLYPYAEALVTYAERHQLLSKARQRRQRETDKEEQLSVPTLEIIEGAAPLEQAFGLIVNELRAAGQKGDVAALLRLHHFDGYVWLSSPEDALDLLAALPVPGFVCRGNDQRYEAWKSVKDLFFAMLANPSLFLDASHPKERIGLFLFAAAVQVHRGRIGGVVREPFRGSREHIDQMRQIFEWLVPQMPRFALKTDVETAIRDVAV